MSIIRTFHNRQNPYVQINKQALCDERLSLEASGLWARCLSRPDDWDFSVSDLSKRYRIGRNSIYRIINELIALGYAMRVDVYEKGENGKFKGGKAHYVFFEFSITEEERRSYEEEFKKSFRRPDFRETRCGDTQNGTLLKTDRETKDIEETKHIGPEPVLKEILQCPEKQDIVNPEYSADAECVYSLFLGKIRERRPSFKEPNKKAWMKEIDGLLRIDKRALDEIKAVIAWSMTHSFWSTACLSPLKLRKFFDEMCLQMSVKPDQKPVAENNVKANKRFVAAVKEKYPQSFVASPVEVDEAGAHHTTRGARAAFSMRPDEFRKAFIGMLGSEYNPREWGQKSD